MINDFAQEQIYYIKKKCKVIKPLVAIHCITFNHEQYLKYALDGFLMQKTNFPFVVIVHDDASLDNTAHVLKKYVEKYPDLIFPIYENENQFVKGKNAYGEILKIMNAAIDSTGAKYIAYCEGDDYWIDPFKLQKQVDFLENNPEYGMVYGIAKTWVQSKNTFSKNLGIKYTSVKDILSVPYQIPASTILYRRDFYQEVYDKYLKTNNWLMVDYPLTLGLASESKIYFIPDEMSVYRILEESACHIKDYEKLVRFKESAFEVSKFFAQVNNIPLQEINLDNNYNSELFKISRENNKLKKAFYYYKKIKPLNKKERLYHNISFSLPTFLLLQYLFKLKTNFHK